MEYSFLNTLSINYVFKKVTKIIKSEYSCIYIEFSLKKNN